MWTRERPHRPDWLSSKEFKFIVGTNEDEFTKFSEYLYTGDFFAPGFVPIANTSAHRTCISNTLPEFDDNRITHKAWVRFRTRKRYAFHELPTIYEASMSLIDYSETLAEGFPSIAKLYSFAHYYDIRKLERFCQAKIHSLMALAPCREEVCDLLQFCEIDPGGRGLKELVVEYCALNLRWLLPSKKFHTLIEEYPKASLGIMKKLNSFSTFYFKHISKGDVDFPEEVSSDSEADWYHEAAEN
ncbi:hypothetical protein MY10362_008849 [Beauveria mimosiformis]